MKKTSILSIMLSAVLAVSCLNDSLSEPKKADGMVASLEEQALAIETSLADIDAVMENSTSEDLAQIKEDLQDHVTYLKSGVSWLNGTATTLQMQKALAKAAGSIEAEASALKALEDGASIWIGKDFTNCYKVAQAAAKAEALASKLSSGQIVVEGLESNVEAGLGKELDADELSSLDSSVKENVKKVAQLSSKLAETGAALEAGYLQAIEAAVTQTDEPDLAMLGELNDNAVAVLKSAGTSLESISERVDDLETRLDGIVSRLEEVEADINELLEMIQSVTFMSEFAEDYATAYYTLSDMDNNGDGLNDRIPSGSMELNYLVRPAAAAEALESAVLNTDIAIIGYYAGKIQQQSVAAKDFIDFNISAIAADKTSGIVTLTVDADLDNDFYLKNVGAKLALTITSGNTDFATKFIEIKPKDNSGKTYIESINLSASEITIKKGDTAQLEVEILPANATDQGLTWIAYSNGAVCSVDNNGMITGVEAGDDMIVVTTDGTDEWGRQLTAQCKVTVQEAIGLSGKKYVEVGNVETIELDYNPNNITIKSVSWSVRQDSEAKGKMTVDAQGNVTGVSSSFNSDNRAYDELELVCNVETLNGIVELTHPMKVVEVQPKAILTSSLGENINSVELKVGNGFDITSTISPDNVDGSKFYITYRSGNTGVIIVQDLREGKVTASGVGEAYVDIEVQQNGQYLVSGATTLKKTIYFSVLPYYVKSMAIYNGDEQILPKSTLNLAAGSSTQLTAKLTSDTDGHEPTDQSLSWTSSNPDAVAVDENGKITVASDAGGQVATITIKTNGENSRPEGESPIMTMFTVNVTAAWKQYEVGDFVLKLSDGTIEFCSSVASKPSGSTVVGIVISKENPRATDVYLPETCSHGIALGLGEGSGNWWNSCANDAPYSVYKFYADNYGSRTYEDPRGVYYASNYYYINNNGNYPYGYNNTELFKEFLALQTECSSGIITALNNYSIATPEDASDWYLPSVYEMYLISQCGVDINSKLEAASGTSISDAWYWVVSEIDNNYNSPGAAIKPLTGELQYPAVSKSTDKNVRFVFAF